MKRVSTDNTLEKFSVKGDAGKGHSAEEDAMSRKVFLSPTR